jgi:hypothetical protein
MSARPQVWGVSTPGGGGSLGGSGFSTPGIISSFLLGAAAGNDAANVIAGHLANHHLGALAAALPRPLAATDDLEQARSAMSDVLSNGGGTGYGERVRRLSSSVSAAAAAAAAAVLTPAAQGHVVGWCRLKPIGKRLDSALQTRIAIKCFKVWLSI